MTKKMDKDGKGKGAGCDTMRQDALRQDPTAHAFHIGLLAKTAPAMHDIEYKIGFHLNENTYFQRFVSKEVMEKGVRVRPIDYFKSLAFLTYFSEIIEPGNTACDNLVTISKALRAEEREKGVDKGASYVRGEAVLFEIALLSKAKGEGYYLDKKVIAAVKKRYEAEGQYDLGSSSKKQIDPYYEAVGQMVCDIVSKGIAPYLLDVRNRTGLLALIFTDMAISAGLKDSEKTIKEYLDRKDFLNSSLAALDSLAKVADRSMLEKAIIGADDNA